MRARRPFDATELQLLIVAGQVRFSDANHFNDPWDCRPRLAAPIPKDAADLEQIISEFRQMAVRASPIESHAEIEQQEGKFFCIGAKLAKTFTGGDWELHYSSAGGKQLWVSVGSDKSVRVSAMGFDY